MGNITIPMMEEFPNLGKKTDLLWMCEKLGSSIFGRKYFSFNIEIYFYGFKVIVKTKRGQRNAKFHFLIESCYIVYYSL